MIRFSQQDPRWKNNQLGTGVETIGDSGCFLTCFSMITGADPATLNKQMVVHGGFSGSLIIPSVVPSVYPAIWFESQVWCSNNPANLDTIDKALFAGKPVIVQVDTSPVVGVQSHFVILTKKMDNDYLMIDPWPLNDVPPATLLGRYGKGRKAEIVITYVLVIGGIHLDMVDSDAIPVPVPDVGLVETGDNGVKYKTVITDYINLRLDASTKQPPLGKVTRGMKLSTAGEPVNGFYPVVVWVSDGGGEYLK